MKTTYIICVLFLFSLRIFGQDVTALDNKYGFREARLESPVDSFNNLKLIGSNMDGFPDMELYYVPDADLHIGSSTLDNVSYWFYKDKLMMIEITVSSGSENKNGVLKVLEAAYGKAEPAESVNGAEAFEWAGKKVLMSYNLGDNNDPTGDIQIYSLIVYSEYKENEILLEEQKKQEILDAAKNL